MALSVAGSLLGAYVSKQLLGDDRPEAERELVQLISATAGALVPPLLSLLLPAGRTHPVMALFVAVVALALTYTGVYVDASVRDKESLFPVPSFLPQPEESGGLPHNVAIDNDPVGCAPADDLSGWDVSLTVDWYLPEGVERPQSIRLHAFGASGWIGHRDVQPGAGKASSEHVTIRVQPPEGTGGLLEDMTVTVEADRDNAWSEDDEGDNAVSVECTDIGGTGLANDVTFVPGAVFCSVSEIDLPSAVLDVRLAWSLGDPEGVPESVGLAASSGDGAWQGSTRATTGVEQLLLELSPTVDGSPPPTEVTVVVDTAGEFGEGDEENNQMTVQCAFG